MQQCTIIYWCCILLSLFGITYSFYLPSMKSSRHQSSESNLSNVQSNYKGTTGQRFHKRGNWYGLFTGTFRSHANLYEDKRMFVSKMFDLFDLNGNGCIDRKEFRSILIFLDIL